jgi:deoxyribodipyrimidine photo-lyase
MTTSIWWIRRDMRLEDNGALRSAAASGSVVPLFVVDPAFASASETRRAYMFATLRSLDEATGGAVVLRYGKPHEVIPVFAKLVGADSVHVAADFAPYGRKRDEKVGVALAENQMKLVVADTPYAVRPGTVVKDDATPLKVFTPFYKRWLGFLPEHTAEVDVQFADRRELSEGYPSVDSDTYLRWPIGEDAVWARWDEWSVAQLQGYKENRNIPSVDGTSQLSAPLRFGVVHPRQLLQRLGSSDADEHFRRELAWREFYADVLFHQPATTWVNLQTKMNVLPVDTDAAAKARFAQFCEGNTGFPIVDAGIRQMLQTGWMHNRVRMIVASFLVKDLHVPWQWGAKFFMDHLVDGDIASNNHGWQWTAGTGTDAAPFFRVFNPTSQSEKFDPTGEYVRQWVPEIAGLDNNSVHAPWELGLLAPSAYPPPMVDHANERLEALSRYKSVSGK